MVGMSKIIFKLEDGEINKYIEDEVVVSMSSIADSIEEDLKNFHGIPANQASISDENDDWILHINQTCDGCYKLFPNEELEPIYDENNGSSGVEMYCFDCYPEAKEWFDKDRDEKIADKIVDGIIKDQEEKNES